ncbi:hypothetical protein [Streptomyces sp. NPDC020965]
MILGFWQLRAGLSSMRLAEALGVDDLASLTGDERLAAATYT